MTEEEKKLLLSASFGVKVDGELEGLRVQRLHPNGIWLNVWEWEPPVHGIPKGELFRVGLTVSRGE